MFKDYSEIVGEIESSLLDADFSWVANEQLRVAMTYSLNAPGKRLRPAIIIKLGQLFGIDRKPLESIALAVEATHCSTLIHDDLPSLDDDELRRGRATSHVKFGEAVAILAGDGLYSWAVNTLLNEEGIPAESRLKLGSILTESYTLVCAGQVQDVESRQKQSLSLDQLKQKNTLKTGALFRFCFEAPAIVANKPETYLEDIRALADDFGQLFQITDDILDATGSEAKLGKKANKDVSLGTETYVSILGLEAAISEAKQISNSITNRVGDDIRDFVLAITSSVLKRIE